MANDVHDRVPNYLAERRSILTAVDLIERTSKPKVMPYVLGFILAHIQRCKVPRKSANISAG